MEKVKVTKEQAEAIEHALQEVDEYKGNPDMLLLHASMNNVNFRNELHPLDTIDIVTLAKALYIGYEVEPEFKPHDYVVYADGTVGQFYPVPKGHEQQWPVRHATPEEIAEEKERRFWNKHGRDAWILEEGDVLRHNITGDVFVVDNDSDGAEVHFENGKWWDMEEVKKYFNVVCFAEDRKDVKANA